MAEVKILKLNEYGFPQSLESGDTTTVDQLTITSGPVLSGTGINMSDDSISGVDTISFTDTAGTIAGIQNQNLLDKAATETISGAYTIDGNALTLSENLAFDADSLVIDRATADDIQVGNLLDKSADETITGEWTYNNNIAFDNTSRTIAGIQNGNLLDKTASEAITGAWTFNTALPTSTVTPSNSSDLK